MDNSGPTSATEMALTSNSQSPHDNLYKQENLLMWRRTISHNDALNHSYMDICSKKSIEGSLPGFSDKHRPLLNIGRAADGKHECSFKTGHKDA